MTLVEMALSELNQDLVSLINREGGRAVGLDGQDGRFIRARPIAPPADDPDAPALGFVGDVDGIDTGLIDLLLSRDSCRWSCPSAWPRTTPPTTSTPTASRARSHVRSRRRSWC
jgi:acetylglutamate kinase